MPIRFGTSGWRAIIAAEFTFDNVESVTRAICGYLKSNAELGRKVLIGHDSRFMGERFTDVAAEIAVNEGFEVLHCPEPVPTPTMSHAIRVNGAAGGINFTASHNPPEYQGMKFSTSDGAPALPEATGRIEKLIDEGTEPGDSDKGSDTRHDPKTPYLEDIASKIDLDAIAKAGGRYGFDPLWGTARGYLDKCLRDRGVEIETLHDWRDVTFGGQAPEPGEEHIQDLKRSVVEKGYTLGLATDGDADRFGIIDQNGTFVTPNQFIALCSDYLAESRGWTEGLARSVATSHLIDRVAAARSLKLYETPVGFKYIGDLINRDEIILGGEESAGLSIKGHYPEKDGILACLLAAEMTAVRGTSLSQQLTELYDKVGRLFSGRIGVKLTPETAAKLKEKLAKEPTEVAGRKVREINRIDGAKFLFDNNAWMLMRPSGTEPVVRIYAESESKQDLDELLEQGRRYLLD